MRIAIDASNILAGGGLTHLLGLLGNAQPEEHGIKEIDVWACKSILQQLPQRSWLRRRRDEKLEHGYLRRALWQKRLENVLAMDGCQLLFVPGGLYVGTYRPYVVVSQNLLPFEPTERARFGWSKTGVRLRALARLQGKTFKSADGVIFLTRTARDIVLQTLRHPLKRSVIVPHGISNEFFELPRNQQRIDCYTVTRPFRFLYVSIVNMYKHQWHVVKAVARLREEGIPVRIDLIGPAYPPCLKRLHRTLETIPNAAGFISYKGPVSHEQISWCYKEADAFVFASSCENMPIILLEAMASGLPIACSDRGPMPEVLGGAGLYFDPENPVQIADALRELIRNQLFRTEIAKQAHERAHYYSWERCANDTFAFLARVAQDYTRSFSCFD